MEENHNETWEKHLDYLQREVNGTKGQSVGSSNICINCYSYFFILLYC
jgi:hypothetical protein